MYKVVFHKDKKGISEVENYINGLRKQKQNKDSRIKLNKIITYIDQLSKKGLKLGTPYIKYLEDNIWELRPLRDRIFFTYIGNNKFVLLNYFIKQTQKTPRREIEKAKRYLEDYKKERKGNE